MVNKHFKVYRSSAGSGKTHTLVKEYIRLALLDKSEYRFAKILAITFTNKAAEEMKERVIQNLFSLSLDSSHRDFKAGYLKEMVDFTGLPAHEIQKKAARVFKTMLHNYHLLKITTIDKFTVSLVNSFARDLGLDTDHNIELDTNLILDSAVTDLLEESGTDKGLTDLLMKFYEDEMEEGSRLNMRKTLVEFGKLIWNEEGYNAIEQLKKHSELEFKDAYAYATKEIKSFNDYVVSRATLIIQIVEDLNVQADDLHYKGSGSISRISEARKSGFSAFEWGPRLDDFLAGKALSKSVSPEVKSQFDLRKPEIDKLLVEIKEFHDSNKLNFFIHKMVKENAFSMSLLKRLMQNVEKYKEQNNVVLLSEFHRMVASIVKDEPAPFIYERFGERVKNVFVDEFQDTSTLQFMNLVPMFEESLAKNDLVLLVGDAKQSIYRWRNGNVQQFIDLPVLHPELLENNSTRAGRFKGEYEENVLPVNYRSSREIIAFNNTFFKSILQLPEFQLTNLQKAYHDVLQEVAPNKEGGFVQVKKLEFDKDSLPDRDVEIERFVLETINKAEENNYKRNAVCILVRDHKEGDFIYRILNKNGIEVSSNQALSLSSSTSVNLVVLFMEALLSQTSPLLVRKLAFDLADYRGELKQKEPDFVKIRSNSIEAALADFSLLFSINFSRKVYAELNLLEKVKYLFSVMDLELGNAFVVSFLEHVHSTMLKYGSDENIFLEWWKSIGHAKTVHSGQREDAVNVMTIHKSKGLQFPIVIMPFLVFDSGKNDAITWETEVPGYTVAPIKMKLTDALKGSYLEPKLNHENEMKLLDRLNLLYVGFTRAEEQLHVVIDVSKKSFASHVFAAVDTAFGFKSDELSFGQPRTKSEQFSHISLPEIKLEKDTVFQSWYDKLLVSTGRIKDNDAGQEARLKGIKLHQIASAIQAHVEVEKVLMKFRAGGMINDEEQSEFKEELNAFFSSNEYSELFEGATSIHNEVSITDGQGNVLRPDKLIISKDSVTVIDFKTGEESADHLKQLTTYANVLAASGYKVVRPYLYYFRQKKWMKVTG